MACCRSIASIVPSWYHCRVFFKTATPCSRLLFRPFYCKFRDPGFWYPHRAMSSESNGAGMNSTHLERTEDSPREEVMPSSVTPATVTEISQLSETVKRLCLKVEDNRFIFKPGQWVDFFIPDVPTVGGFTICSSPREVQETRTVELAVKQSEHPPALWVHTKCCVGSKVHMRVGGDFYFDPSPDEPSPDLLLVAGGVGINPMYSIVQHVADISSDPRRQYTGKTTLLFSAKNQDELLFKDSLLEISKKCPSILCKFFVTKQEKASSSKTETGSLQTTYEHGRINESRIKQAVSSLNKSRLLCYICGPPPMIKNVSDILYKMNIAKNRIHFEKWW